MSYRDQARNLCADAVARQGSAWKNASDSIRAGKYANVWIEAAIASIERALRDGPSAEV